MKILITSGGTKIPIDEVRHIGNMSHGTLGAKLAKDALIGNNEVIFFCAEGSKTPMSANINYQKMTPEACGKAMNEVSSMWNVYGYCYTEIQYKSFWDYQSKLPLIISLYKPDVVILAAAVSDYETENVIQGKIRTGGDLNIALKPLPKVISEVRNCAGPDAFVIGFKLLVGVPETDLIKSAEDSIVKNKLNLVCANDLRTLQAGNHKILLVKPENQMVQETDPEHLWQAISKMVKEKK